MHTSRTVEYRRLGKCGLRVSVPIIGGASFGTKKALNWVLEEEEAFKVLKAAWDKGINTIDTSNVYSNGWSERVIGKFIQHYNIPRNKIVILTKCFGIVHPDPSVRTIDFPELGNTRDFVNNHGLSRAAIFNAVEASLERLQTPYIDLYQIHRFDPNVTPEELMKALHDLVQSGKVRYIGASSMRTWQFAMLNEVAERNDWTKFVSMQPEYSLLYREEEREMIPYCNHNGIGIIPWSPMAGGSLARPLSEAESSLRVQTMKTTRFAAKHDEADAEIIKRVEEIAKKKAWSMSEVALAWVCSKIASPIVGLNSAERVEAALVSGYTLTAEEATYLEEPYVPKRVRGHA